MHFAIPETKVVNEESGSSYTVYRIFIDGIFHCSVRYSQLLALHENLKQFHSDCALPYFPPKKLFSLSKSQLEDRQYCLQKYFQTICQHNDLVRSPVLRKFLLNMQQKINENRIFDQELVVCVLNGTQVSVKTSDEDSSEIVLNKVCEHLRVNPELMQYFALFVQKQSDNGVNYLIHYLQDYESPILTLRNIPGQNKVVIRKSYWDPALDFTLVRERWTLNLLYSQVVFDIEKGWIITNEETQKKLATLQSRGAKREYLEIARALKFYGYLRFDFCICDCPEVGTESIVSVGPKELVFTPKVENIPETHFRITRIRCWKISTLSEFNKEIQLSFEYLNGIDKLQWITVISEYVHILSVCLQSVVDELMMKRKTTNSDQVKNEIKEESSIGSSSKSFVSLQESTAPRKLKCNETSNSQFYFIPSLENDSFENIGDDDL